MRIEGLPAIVDNETNRVRRADRPQPGEKPLSPQAEEEMGRYIKAHRKNLNYSFDRVAKRVVVTIKNGGTIQIPDEKLLKLSIALQEAAKRYQKGRETTP